MAETILSPGVLATENDQSFITQQPIQAGAAIIGPTPKGKVGIPVLCTTYSDYLNKFGSTFLSGSQTYTYFTSIAAYNYFNSGGNTLLVTRVVSGSTSLDWTPATSSAIPSSTALTSATASVNFSYISASLAVSATSNVALTSASLSVNLTYISASLASSSFSDIALTSASISVDLTYISASLAAFPSTTQSLNINGATIIYTGSSPLPNSLNIYYINTSSFSNSTVADYVFSSSGMINYIHAQPLYSSSLNFISSSNSSPNLVLTSTNPNGLTGNSYYVTSGSTTTYFTGGTNTTIYPYSQSLNINGINLIYTGSSPLPNTSTEIYISTSSFAGSTVADYVFSTSAILAFSSSIALYTSSLQFISSSNSSPSLLLTSTASNGLTGNSYFVTSGSTTTFFTGGTNTTAFVLETLSEGIIMNSTGPIGSFGTLLSGSADNFRWQIVSPNINDGTFSLLIRQGNDSDIFPSVVESWGPLSLDPFASNYIEKVIGNQVETIRSDNGEYYVQLTGSFQNNSSIIRVKQVNQTTPNYLDNNGVFKPQFTGSLPNSSNGTFGSALGTNIPSIAGNYYENITSNNIQGLTANAYVESISLLANKEAYKYNILVAPGLISSHGAPSSTVITQLQTTVQERADAIAIIDLVPYNAQIGTVTSTAAPYNTSYVATYWPWLKTIDPNTGNQVWIPASTMIPSVYAFNDSVAAPWFAPAGINRGILPTVIQAERILTQGNRDTLYQSNVNPIATLSGAGIVVFGQKTLQKKKSALDRVNVRRLLIELKNYISQVADTFVFEQNDANTRNELLAIINPYLLSIQQQQGLISFKVIMDESNNPPYVVDQNQLVGQIYLQPTKTIEFILLDFNILPTGAVFPA